jgi:hypothetical protein
MDLHLYQHHKQELVRLPIGKGSLDFRIKYAIDEGKRVGGINLQNFDKENRDKMIEVEQITS